MKRLLEQIGRGWLRLHILLSIAGPLLFICLDVDKKVFVFIFLAILYWILAIAVHWIIDGFRSDQKRDQSPTNNDPEQTTFQTTEALKVSNTSNDNGVHEQPMGEISLDLLDRGTIEEPMGEAEHGDKSKEDADEVKSLNKYIRLLVRIPIYVLIFFVNYMILFTVFLFSMLAMTGDKGFASRQSPIWAILIAFGTTRYLGKKVISKWFPRFKSVYAKK